MASLNTLQSFYDVSLYGTRTSTGAIKELYNVEAYENSMLLWMSSLQGDYLRNTGKGGYLIPHLTKAMSEDRSNALREAIIVGLNDDYERLVIVKEVIVDPDYDNRLYRITVKAFAKDIRANLEVEAILKALN